MAAAASGASGSARLSIGEALARLRSEFPEENIKESKIRFLEAEGLVDPERTASGYRKYSEHDMERLRYILRAQKEQYLPLRVIREQLDAIDEGRAVPGPASSSATATLDDGWGLPTAASYGAAPDDVRISRRELVKTAGISEELLIELESFGLVQARRGSGHFDSDAVLVARVAGELAGFGIEPRHLRSFRTAADREVSLVEQVVSPIRHSREAGAQGRAAEAGHEVAALSVRLHATLVRVALRGLR